MRQNYTKYTGPIDSQDKKAQAIYADLCAGKNKKEIANSYKVNICEVMTIAQRYKTGIEAAKAQTPPIYTMVCNSNELKEVTTTEEKEAEKVARKNKRKSTARLSDDRILAILEDLEKGSASMLSIAKIHGVSQSTVSRIKHEYLDEKKQEVSAQQPVIEEKHEEELVINEAAVEPVEEVIPEETVIFKRNDFIEALLIKDRHNVPKSCEEYVFDGPMTQELMFDYETQEKIVKSWIENHINFTDGKADKSVMLYITGLPCASATVIKVCAQMKVNLCLMHYYAKTNSYKMQVIWDCFDTTSTIPYAFTNITSSRFDSIILHKCTMNQLLASETAYDVVVNINSDDGDTITNSIMRVAVDMDIAYDIFKENIINNINREDKISIFIHENSITNGKMIPNKTLAKSYNYR